MASKGPKRGGNPAAATPPVTAPAILANPAKVPAPADLLAASKPIVPSSPVAASKAVAVKPAAIEPTPAPAPVATPPEPVPAAPAAVEPPKPVPVAEPVAAAKPVEPFKMIDVPKTIEAAEAATPPAPTPVAATTHKEIKIMATAFQTPTFAAPAMFGDINERTKAAMEKSGKMVEEMTDFAKGNVEAVVESTRIAAKGAEDILKYTAEYGRSTIETANSTVKKFASVKSPTEFFQLQSEFTKSMLDSMVAESSKFTEGYLKLMGEAAQPLSNRFAVAAEKVKTAA